MITINADNVLQYITENYKEKFSNPIKNFEEVLFNCKMPFSDFRMVISADTGENILYFSEDCSILSRVKIDHYYKRKNEKQELALTYYMELEETGKPKIIDHSVFEIVRHKDGILAGVNDINIHNLMFTALFTIQFMHCKNIEMVEKTKPMYRQKPKNKKKMPMIKYHVLNISPIKKILETEGAIKANGLPKALHICRGHFKAYNAKGLFGKYTGTFWVGEHIKGNAKNGVIIKDYKVLTE